MMRLATMLRPMLTAATLVGMEAPPLGPRVCVIGTSGAGKTTLSLRLAALLGAEHVELDAFQHGPGWTQATPEELRERTLAALRGERWVCDGNYGAVRQLVWERATDVVWLDYGLWTVMHRVVRRSLLRAIDRRPLWNGNREHWRDLVSAEHPIRWAWRTHRGRRVRLSAILESWGGRLRVVRLRSPAQGRLWLAGLQPSPQTAR